MKIFPQLLNWLCQFCHIGVNYIQLVKIVTLEKNTLVANSEGNHQGNTKILKIKKFLPWD